MDAQLIKNTLFRFTNLNIGMPVCGMHITAIKNDIIKISQDIKNTETLFSNELFRLKDMLFNNQNGFINPVAYGEIVAILRYLDNKCNNPQKDMWASMHPKIERVSKQLFLDGHFANAAEDAFIEINDRVKKIFHKLEPSKPIPDGRDVMNKVFADGDKAMIEICDRSTDTGTNIHEGTRFMLAGAMAALRNPKAHSNNVVITQEECLRRLMFASMLMYKIDEAVAYSCVVE
ncbi:MAG: TIGR02391 family protein [Clostridiales bacterium]|nr:TIGR02391 family protein [Clostridiales bacterium]